MFLSSRLCGVVMVSVAYRFLFEDLMEVDDVVVFFTMVLPEPYPPPPELIPPPPMLQTPLPLPELKPLRPPDPP